MPKQRKSLSSIIGAEPPKETAEVISISAPSGKEKTSWAATKKKQTLYLDPRVHEQLREIAFHENTKMHDLVMEGLDLLFKARGQKSAAELTADE